MKINRRLRGQEEMVGFILIVIIVAVIMVIFLGISLNKPKTETGKKSEEIRSFLNAMSIYTTDCAINYDPNYANVKDLVQYCSRNEDCLNGENSCDVLEEDLTKITEISWQTGQNNIKGYQMSINSTNILIFNGNKTSQYIGDYISLPAGIIEFKVYY